MPVEWSLQSSSTLGHLAFQSNTYCGSKCNDMHGSPTGTVLFCLKWDQLTLCSVVCGWRRSQWQPLARTACVDLTCRPACSFQFLVQFALTIIDYSTGTAELLVLPMEFTRAPWFQYFNDLSDCGVQEANGTGNPERTV